MMEKSKDATPNVTKREGHFLPSVHMARQAGQQRRDDERDDNGAFLADRERELWKSEARKEVLYGFIFSPEGQILVNVFFLCFMATVSCMILCSDPEAWKIAVGATSMATILCGVIIANVLVYRLGDVWHQTKLMRYRM